MATKSNWLMGCGIGCLAVIVITVVLGVGAFRTGQRVVERFEAVGESQRELAERYGGTSDYAPAADGRLDAGRIEGFLRIQEELLPVSTELFEHWSDLNELEEGDSKSLGSVVRGFRSMIGLGRGAADFLEQRNSALLREGMGLGEYTYLYVVAYNGWLGHPFDPDFGEFVHESDDGESRGVELRALFLHWLETQRDAAVASSQDPAWVSALEDELLAIRMADLRTPWADGPPPRIAEALAPYRGRFEATYVRLDPLVGVGSDKAEGGFDFTIE